MNNIITKNAKIEINQDNLYAFLKEHSIKHIESINPPVTFDEKGISISYWNDNDWDFSKEKTKLNGYTSKLVRNDYMQLSDEFYTELKYISLLAYLKDYEKYRYSNAIQRIFSELFIFVEKSQELGYESICELNNELKFIMVLDKIKGLYTSRSLENRLNTFRKICEIGNKNFPLSIDFGIKQARKVHKGFSIKELAVKYSKLQSDEVNQTLYIPNKIHSKLIAKSIDIIHEKSKNLDNMMAFIEDDYLLYEQIKERLEITDVSNPVMKSKIKRLKGNKTKELLENNQLNTYNSALEVQQDLRLLATACFTLILSFSGMRANEMCNIKIDGFKVVNSEPKMYVIRSYETKISGGQIVDYVTSPIVKDAFDIITKIHEVARKYDNTTSKDDLIISSKHQKLVTYGGLLNLGTHFKKYAEEIGLVLDKDDVKESELLNGAREDIKVGGTWSLASHQFRRTLIVNFVSHRLGSINAVKQQVKHMYATMTEYYAKNSNLAETFNLNVVKEISDIIEEELLDEGVRHYKNFYYSNDVLAGEKGKEIMESRGLTKILSDNEIKQLFKTGLYKISKSIYGYCTKGNLCDKKDAVDPTFCGASCNTMVITKESALNWQKLYIKNKQILASYADLIIGGIPLSAAKTTMQSQNEIAKKIMKMFDINYED